jgi:predicted phosphate transport protein (TIGR00153 family)
MRLSLFPKEPAFFELFTSSADNTVEAAKLYLGMCERYEDPAGTHKLIREKEHQGDEYTHEIIRHLNTTFVTPFDREDIHALASGLDDIMDFIEAAADIFVLHQIERPTQTAIEQARILVRITEAVAGGVGELRKFKGLEKYWDDIDQIENEGDRVYRQAVAELFSGDHKALEVLKWKELYEQAEEAIDACEKVGTILEAIVLKQ